MRPCSSQHLEQTSRHGGKSPTATVRDMTVALGSVRPAEQGACAWAEVPTNPSPVLRIQAALLECLDAVPLAVTCNGGKPVSDSAAGGDDANPDPGPIAVRSTGHSTYGTLPQFCLSRPLLSLLRRALARSPGAACAKSAGSEPLEPLSAALVRTTILMMVPQSSCHECKMKSYTKHLCQRVA